MVEAFLVLLGGELTSCVPLGKDRSRSIGACVRPEGLIACDRADEPHDCQHDADHHQRPPQPHPSASPAIHVTNSVIAQQHE
jgi:hypothetical protein